MDTRTPESQMIFTEQLKALKRAIQRLSKKHRDVFIFREYGEMSYEEIAATLKVKEGTVMSRLNFARKRIMASVKGGKIGKKSWE